MSEIMTQSNIFGNVIIPEEDPQFEKPPPERHKCIYCKRILREPYQTCCGHYLCLNCVKELKDKNCPGGDDDCTVISFSYSMDNSDGKDNVFPDKAMKKEILTKNKAYCLFKHFGCDKILTWMELINHKESCSFAVYPCPNVKYGCPLKEIKSNEINRHTKNCDYHPDKVIDCEYGCGKRIERKNMKQHFEVDCSSRNVICSLNELGCEAKGTQTEIEQHLDEDKSKHYNIISTNITQNADSIEMLITELSTYGDKVMNLQDEVATLKERLNEKNNDYDRLKNLVANLLKQNSNNTNNKELENEVRKLQLNLEYPISYEGILIWRINNYTARKQDAIHKRNQFLHSPNFYSSKYGYKMRARVYLNGEGAGLGNFLSLYLQILKSENDDLLKWPFRQQITLMVVNRSENNDKQNVLDKFRPNAQHIGSYERPTSDSNKAAGCPKLISQSLLEDPSQGFLINDEIVLKICVDTTNI